MEFEITLADNGYILKSENDGLLYVYENEAVNLELLSEICADLIVGINGGIAPKFNVKIELCLNLLLRMTETPLRWWFKLMAK